MPSLDANGLLRWLIGDVPAQANAVQRLMDGPERLILTDACLLEVVFVMQSPYKLDREQVALAFDAVLGEAAFDMDETLWHDVMADYLIHPKLSVVDVYQAHKAQADAAGPLYTFDRKLASQQTGAALIEF
ncbi:MAG: PIN domain-containing protein [Propionibacteriaceae bacterium]|nr:PIN domain-containing protein [Propionibacteriaceae bacterium]